jgi:hypothetical protein
MESLTKTCTKCKKEKELDDFYPKLRGKLNRSSECRECFKFRITTDRRVKGKSPNTKMQNGLITYKERDKFLLVQNNSCFICGTEFNESIKPCVDHCHTTGQVRGLLCSLCNSGLGFFKDDVYRLVRAIEYISNPKWGKKRF